jgi:single-strand DNA-binding protein
MNKVILSGNLGKDPELRYTASGTAVASFSLATTEKVKNQAGEWEDKTEWHNVVFWARRAEVLGEHATKGMKLLVEGKLRTRKWQDKDGKDRYTTEVVGDAFEFLTPKGDGGRSGGSRGERPARDNSGYGAGSYEEPHFNPDDDIPFS